MASVESKRKRQAWEDRFGRYRTSGLTVARFCAQERVSVNTFYYWARRVGTGTASPAIPPSLSPRSSLPTAKQLRSAAGCESIAESGSVRASGGVVRFRFDAAVEVSVPAECLDAIRCLVECIGRRPDDRNTAFHEIVVTPH